MMSRRHTAVAVVSCERIETEMRELLFDVRHAIAGFRRTPAFTIAAVLSLAIGVGVNTAIYSVASALLLQPLPYADAERLAILWNRSPGLGITEDWFSTAQYFDIKTSAESFEHVAIAIGRNDNLTEDGGEPERVGTIRTSSELLPMLGVQPVLGRLFTTDDEVVGAPGVVLLGHGTWVRRYGSDPTVLGRRVLLNGQPFEIVGVLPSSFSLRREVLPTLGGARDAELVVPLPLAADAHAVRTAEDYNILAKLKRGVTIASAQAEMDALTARLRRDHPAIYPPNGGLTFGVVALQEQVVGDVRWSLLVLMGAVACVLLIACANVANLLLSRGVARQKEIAVRVALGASRGRVVRQLLTESILLALGGSVVAVVFAVVSLDWIRSLGVASVPRVDEIAMDGEVLLFTLVIAMVSGGLFGAAPAWRLARVDVQTHLKDAGRGSAGADSVWAGGSNLRRLLVMSELAIAVVLLIAAGLLIRSFARLQDVPPGFNPSNILTAELTMTGRKYNDRTAVMNAYRELWQRLPTIRDATATGGISSLPLSQMFAWGPITVEGRMPSAGEEFINVDIRITGGDYFKAMEIPLVAGRAFDEQDTIDKPRVALVDAHMARELWPGQDPIGKRVRSGGQNSASPWITIVGVVGRVKQYTLESDSRMALYFTHAQVPTREMNLVLKSARAPEALTNDLRATLKAFDPDLPMFNVRTMDHRVNESLARRRFAMQLLTLFAAIALALATIGIYGVMSYLVSQGTRELGIRLALGATPRNVVWLIGRHTALIAGAGVAAGLAIALGVTRFMQSLLFEIDAIDPLTYAAIGLFLLSVALTAGFVPAIRAGRIDPLRSLHAD
jgi:predicted permease